MIESYTMNEDGELAVTWEAETPEDMAELKEHALRAIREGLPEDTSLTIWPANNEAADRG